MQVLTIIQARLSSTRLPGKVLLPIAGKTMLEHVIDAAPEPRILAIPNDEPKLSEFSKNLEIDVFEGPPHDVLSRFWQAMLFYELEFLAGKKVDYILRLTADCPRLTKAMVVTFISRIFCPSAPPEAMILTNRPNDPDGYDMELFSRWALEQAYENTFYPADREHVTTWMYRVLDVIRVPIFGELGKAMEVKVSVDTHNEYRYVKKMLEEGV